MPRPITPPPGPEDWYTDNQARPGPGDVQKICPSCGRIFWTVPAEERTFPHLQEPIYCSRTCKATAQNRRWYQRHKEKPA